MKKMIYSLIGLIILSMGIFGCSKKESKKSLETNNLKRVYNFSNKQLTLTYNLNNKGRIEVTEKTKDNLELFEIYSKNKNSGVVFNAQENSWTLYKNSSDFTDEHNKPNNYTNANTLKSTRNTIYFSAYFHPNYNLNCSNDFPYYWSNYNGSSSEKNRIFSTSWNSYGYARSYVGNWQNDQITSLKMDQFSWGSIVGLNYFTTRIFEDINWGGHWKGFSISGTNTQISGCYDIRQWNMSSFL